MATCKDCIETICERGCSPCECCGECMNCGMDCGMPLSPVPGHPTHKNWINRFPLNPSEYERYDVDRQSGTFQVTVH